MDDSHIAVELLSNVMKPGQLRTALLAGVDFIKLVRPLLIGLSVIQWACLVGMIVISKSLLRGRCAPAQ